MIPNLQVFKALLGSVFHRHGLFCSTHPFLIMYLTAVAIISCSYPAVRLFDAHLSRSLSQSQAFASASSPSSASSFLSFLFGGGSSSSSSSSPPPPPSPSSLLNHHRDDYNGEEVRVAEQMRSSGGQAEVYEAIHFWDKPASVARTTDEDDVLTERFTSQPYLRIDQFTIHLNRSTHSAGRRKGSPPMSPGVLFKPLMLSLFDFQQAVDSFRISDPDGSSSSSTYSLRDICFKIRGRCLVNSPLEFWLGDKDKLISDPDIMNTVSQHTWESSFGAPISVRSVFGSIHTDPATGTILAADSLMVTYYLEVPAEAPARNLTIAKWERFWAAFISGETAPEVFQLFKIPFSAQALDFEANPDPVPQNETPNEAPQFLSYSFNEIQRGPGPPKHLYYKFKQPNIQDSAELWLLIVCYFLVFMYISLSLGRIELVKSKFGLGFSAVFTIFASLVMSVGTCSIIGVELSLVPWEVLPFVLMVVGVENTFLITKAVVTTSIDLPVKERIGLGLSHAGYQMTITLFAEFFLMLIGSLTSVPTLQEFCAFATFAVLYDYLLHITFFTTVLSIDIRRLELSDLHDHRVVRVMRASAEARRIFQGKGVGCGIMFVFMLVMGLGLYGTTASLQGFSWNSSILSSDEGLPKGADIDIFWTLINPSHLERYVEIQPPIEIDLGVLGVELPGEEVNLGHSDSKEFIWASRAKNLVNGFLRLIQPYHEGGGPLLFAFSVFGALLLSCLAVFFVYFNIPFILSTSRELLDYSKKEVKQTWVRGSYRELTLVGHSDDIECHFGLNGTLASAGLDKTVRIWDIATGEALATFNMHKKSIWQVHCHGDLLATGSSDGHICIWQLSDKRLLHEAGRKSSQAPQDLGSSEHTGGITCLKFDPSGKILYSGSTDKTVKIWDVETGLCLETIAGHKGSVTCLDVNQDFFVSGSEDGTLRVHSAKTRTCRFTLYGHLVGITSLILDPLSAIPPVLNTPSPKTTTTTTTTPIVPMAPISTTPTSAFPPPKINSLGHSDTPQSSMKLISGSQDGVIRIWDLLTGTCNCVLNGHTSAVVALIVDNLTSSLVSSSLDESVRLWNLSHLFRTNYSPQPHSDLQRSPIEPILTIPSQGSTGVTVVDSIIFCGGVGFISLYSAQTLVEVRRIPFDDVEQEDFDPAVIISKITPHDTGVVFDYGDKIKVFHFSEMAVKKKSS